MRLIDADALLKTYKKWIPQLVLPEDEGDRRGVETCIAVLEDAPTIEAESVRHGRWVNKEVDEIRYHVYGNCSVCHERKRIDNYCPNCGAKMDLE